MGEMGDKREEKVELDLNLSKTESDDGNSDTGNPQFDLNSLKQIDCQVGTEQNSDENELQPAVGSETNLSPSKMKECSTGTKVKRKARSTRRRLNAMVNNASLHFSDTDSEGELSTITPHPRTTSPTRSRSLDIQKPKISVTLDNREAEVVSKENMNCLSPDDKGIPRSSSFIDNLTDVDELYPSDLEIEQKERQNSLAIINSPCQGDTDLEDLEYEDEIQPTIYVNPRSDIFCEYSGETITTKEGDGPFSVEIRNKMYCEDDVQNNERCNKMPDIVVLPITDEEDMDVSEEEEMEEACCSQKELLEDFDVLATSQIIMTNINKMENLLAVKDPSDDVTSDCHTDVEDVD